MPAVDLRKIRNLTGNGQQDVNNRGFQKAQVTTWDRIDLSKWSPCHCNWNHDLQVSRCFQTTQKCSEKYSSIKVINRAKHSMNLTSIRFGLQHLVAYLENKHIPDGWYSISMPTRLPKCTPIVKSPTHHTGLPSQQLYHFTNCHSTATSQKVH